MLKIMTVIQDAMCGSVGRKLGDIEVCEMLETVLTTSCQMRLSGRSSIACTRAAVINVRSQRYSGDQQKEAYTIW